jgi:hypothetical protein
LTISRLKTRAAIRTWSKNWVFAAKRDPKTNAGRHGARRRFAYLATAIRRR